MQNRTRTLLALVMGALLLVALPAAFAQDSTDEPTQQAQNTAQAESSEPTASIDANTLNVRSEPSTRGQVIGKVGFDETYPVLRGNFDASWWLIQLPDATGWVSAAWVSVSNQDAVPLDAAPVSAATQSSTTVAIEGATATVLVPALNVRAEPSTTGDIVTVVRSGEVYSVLDQNDSETWWLIDVDGTQGWVSAAFVNVEDFVFATAAPAATQAPATDAPATQEATQQATQQPTVTATPNA